MTLKRFKPDTAREWHLIGRYVHQLGTMMSAVLLFNANAYWVLASLIVTWAGGSAADYFGQQSGELPKKPES